MSVILKLTVGFDLAGRRGASVSLRKGGREAAGETSEEKGGGERRESREKRPSFLRVACLHGGVGRRGVREEADGKRECVCVFVCVCACVRKKESESSGTPTDESASSPARLLCRCTPRRRHSSSRNMQLLLGTVAAEERARRSE